MKFPRKFSLFTAFALAVASFSGLQAQPSADQVRVVSPSDLASIKAAMPPALQAPAKQVRKVLVFSQSTGYYHESTPLGKAFFQLVEKTYRGYTVVLSDDPNDYRYENLKRFDAIVFNNGTHVQNTITDPQIQSDVIRFVREGGGVLGIHAAVDGGWPEFNEMFGHRFNGHPWNAGEVHSFLVEEPAHVCVQHFDDRIFRLQDEIYVSQNQYFNREEARVLISMDLADIQTAAKPGGIRNDNDYPVSYLKAFGSGRVFYTSFGHNDLVYKDRKVLTHYLAALQYACGDLDAADSAIPLYERLSQHSGPLYFEARYKLFQRARDAKTEAEQAEVLRLCRQLFDNANATDEGKAAAMAALAQIATPEAVEVAITVLDDSKLSNGALNLITAHVTKEAFVIICKEAWPSLSAGAQVNMINAMGLYGSQFADPLLALAGLGQEAQRLAALKALGMCASSDQASKLIGMKGSPEFNRLRDDVLVEIAGRSPGAAAFDIYQWLLKSSQVTTVQQAAIIGSIKADPSRGAGLINRYLSGDDDALALAAIAGSSYISGDQMTVELGKQVASLSADRARAVIFAISARDDARVPEVLAALLARPEDRLNAIDALGRFGTAAQVPALVSLLGADDKEIAAAAEEALILLRADQVDQTIATQLGSLSDPELLEQLLKVSSARQTPILAPAAMKLVSSSNPNVARQALRAVALCGTLQELDPLCAVAKENQGAASPLKMLASRINDDETVAARLIAHAKQASPDQRAVFIQLLGEFQSSEGERYLVSQLEAGDAKLEVEVVKSLAGWKTASPLQALLKVCHSGQSERARVLAFSGVAQQLSNDKTVPIEEKIATYRQLLKIAKTEESIIEILKGLGNVPHPEAFEILTAHAQQSSAAISAEAKSAMDSYMRQVNWVLTSNFNSAELANAFDSNLSTRWTSQAAMWQSDPMWIVVDMQYEQAVNTVLLDATGSASDYPRKYELYVSNNPDDFGAPVSTGQGATRTEISASARGRYLKIVQNGIEGPWWSIHELKINGRPME
jgi:type 1 glutamine amidotransferase/HEAT repeat protein